MSTTILGIDPSTKSTGIAIFEDNTLIKYKCITASSSNLFTRIEKIITELNNILKTNKIDYVYIEDVFPEDVKHNQQVFNALKYLQGFILYELNKFKINHTFFTASEWRKKCGIKTGRGIKRETLKGKDIEFVENKFNVTVNDDIADAICIGYAGLIKDDDFQLL